LIGRFWIAVSAITVLTSVRFVSTSGASATTSTSSLTLAGLRRRSTLAVSPTWASAVTGLWVKPESAATTSYFPGCRAATR
jgi:hypothetical protein